MTLPWLDDTVKFPDYHITLSDDSDTLFFKIVNQRGEVDARAIQEFPIEKSAIRFAQGESKFSDEEWPWQTVAQKDFSGGRGSADFDIDDTKFYDSMNLYTHREGKVMLSGFWRFADGAYRNQYHMNTHRNIWNWWTLTGSNRYLAESFTLSNGFTVGEVVIWLRRVGTPGTVTCAIYNDSSNNPSTARDTEGRSYSTWDERVPNYWRFGLFSALSSSTQYWVVVYGAATDDANNYWQVLNYPRVGFGRKSSDGSSWSTANYSLISRIADDPTTMDAKPHFYEYKGQLYAAMEYKSGAAGKVFMNGWRGAADAAAANRLRDATQTFVSDMVYEAPSVILVGGPASVSDGVDYRYVSYVNSTELDPMPDWNATLTTLDDYVVIGSHLWYQVDDASGASVPYRDVAVARDFVFFTRGLDYTVRKHREYNNNGTWVEDSWGDGGVYAHKITPIYDPSINDIVLYFGKNSQEINDYRNVVYRSIAPQRWDDSILSGILVEDCGDAWNEQTITNVTASYTENKVRFAVADAFTTGVIGSEAISPAINLKYASKISLTVQSSVELQAGYLELLLDNTANCASPVFNLDFPYLKAGEATDVVLEFDPKNVAGADSIISIGLQLTSDPGAVNIDLIGHITAHQFNDPIEIGERVDNIRFMIPYDDPQRMYVLTDREIGYIEADNYFPVDLNELNALRSPVNARAVGKAGVYLFFNLAGGRVERYYRQNLDNIGPDRDEGLGYDLYGDVQAIIGYPGDRIIICLAYDPFISILNVSPSSSIMLFSGDGWHNLFTGNRGETSAIRNLKLWHNPVHDYSLLWFSIGPDLALLRLPLGPPDKVNSQSYNNTFYGHLITSWYYFGLWDAVKLFRSVKLFTENIVKTGSETDRWIEVDYQLDNDTAWTYAGQITTSPVQELKLGSYDVTGRRIRFRLRFETLSGGGSAILNTLAVKAVGSQDVEYGLAWNTKLSEGFVATNLWNDETGSYHIYTDAETAQAKIKSWIDNLTPLTLRSVYSVFDNRIVILDPISTQPFSLRPDEQIEEMFTHMTAYDIT